MSYCYLCGQETEPGVYPCQDCRDAGKTAPGLLVYCQVCGASHKPHTMCRECMQRHLDEITKPGGLADNLML